MPDTFKTYYNESVKKHQDDIIKTFEGHQTNDERIASLIGLCAELYREINNLTFALQDAGILKVERSK